MTVAISQRLQWLAHHIPRGASVVDVGTDHALLPIYLVQCNRVPFAIATDVAEGPYQAAKNNVQKHGLEDLISVRLGNGLETVAAGEVNVAVIAGMGGGTAAEILAGAKEVVESLDRLQLQPMNASGTLRRYIKSVGFGLATETVLMEDGRYYELMIADKAVSTHQAYEAFESNSTDLELAEEFGPLLLQSKQEVVHGYFQHVAARLYAQLKQLEHGKSEEAQNRKSQVQAQLGFLNRWQQVKVRDGE